MSDGPAADTDEERPDFDSLNRLYYQEDGPAEFISMRLYSLCLIGGEYETVKELLVKGVEYAGFPLQLEPAQDATPELEQQDKAFHEHFLRIEAHHLKHLAIEALLRLFLGHMGLPPCPWWEISRNSVPGRFKDEVERHIVAALRSELQSHVAEVFLALPRDLDSLSEEDQDVSLNLATFLRVFAGDWLDEAKSYNATKHGLTAVPGAAELHLGLTGEQQRRVGYGDSLSHLSAGEWTDGERVWSVTTRWIEIEQALATIGVVTRMLESLWSVARWRYGITGGGSRSAMSSSQFSVDDLRTKGSGSAMKSSRTLFVELRQPHVAS